MPLSIASPTERQKEKTKKEQCNIERFMFGRQSDKQPGDVTKKILVAMRSDAIFVGTKIKKQFAGWLRT